ncbi:hypothetical protein [Clostridium novyi]|uniref:Uncharacterized protein n=1 Tax=Clostridium novyi B str. ATCC 27606 TaxID=1443123 RepID=A0AA40IRH6_CLONO|nr:hypothetical protein [Clostridium novyi]KEI11459.1 hypothetical protein Z959_p0022 [Clostridium novyi B str. ATCC 27606]
MKTIKLSQYFKIIHPTYIILKLIPDTSIRNYNSSNIANTINSLYKDMKNRIRKDKKTWNIEAPLKCSFYIDIMKNKVDFYFIVPDAYQSLFKEKLTETWSKITIETVDTIPNFSKDALRYYLYYKYEDALSLKLDKKSNEPLNSILNTLNIINTDDRVGILYNFMPTSEKNWTKRYKHTIQKIKNGESVLNEIVSPLYILKLILTTILEIIQGFAEGFEELFNTKKEDKVNLIENILNSLIINDKREISKSTQKKKDTNIINTQIVIQSDSPDINRKYNNALAITEAFKSISDDNELTYKKFKTNINYTNFKLSDAAINKTSIEECQNFLQLPGRELLDEHKCISKIDVLESPIPKELEQGTMCIGVSEYKGNKKKAYLSNDKEFKNLTLCLIGPTRSGKTTLISNLSKDSINAGECTILFDFCGNCDLSNDVSKSIKKNKVLNIDCSNFDNLQGLGYNEITPLNKNVFEIYRCAKAKTVQLMTLINALSDNEDLKARMERYLEAAALVVFISNGSIKNVFDVLQDHIIRHNFIDNIPKDQENNLEEYIRALKELDEWSKPTKDCPREITGTKISYIQGILNRFVKLKQNTYMELMLKKDCENNINLVDEIQKSQLICIRMPEIMFSTEQEKDIYCTYWLTKIWGTLQVRKWNIPNSNDRIKVNIVFDELYQVPNCQNFLRSKLSQIAKFSCKPIISCHFLGQIKNIRNELKAANSSYMLISGCDKDNYNELKEELYPYQLEDLLNLKRYNSLNLIKYEDGWSKFITQLPPSIH